MSILKIILGGLVVLAAICSLIYYLTLYPSPLTLPNFLTPTPVTVAVQITPDPTATPVVHPAHTPKIKPNPKPTATPRPPKPAKIKRVKPASQQKWPFGKPKAAPNS
jgi:hypothetical protein